MTWYIVVALLIGAWLGATAMAVLSANHDADEANEELEEFELDIFEIDGNTPSGNIVYWDAEELRKRDRKDAGAPDEDWGQGGWF